MWWRVLKQGKILTLPKTQLRIKKPEISETEDDDCKKKIQEYKDKLETRLTLGDGKKVELLNKLIPEEKRIGNENFNFKDTRPRESYISRNYFLRGSRIASEFIDFYLTLDLLPEEVACKALDMLNSLTQVGEADINKSIDNYTITVMWSKYKRHSYELPSTEKRKYRNKPTIVSRMMLEIDDQSTPILWFRHERVVPNEWEEELDDVDWR